MPRAPPGGVRGAATAGRPGDRFGPGAGGAVQRAELRKRPGTKSGEEGSGTRHRHDTVAAVRAERPSLCAARVAGSVRGSPLGRCRLHRTCCIRATATRSAVPKRLPSRERCTLDTRRGGGRSILLSVVLMEVRVLPVGDAEGAEVRIEGSAKPMDGTAC